MLQLLLTKRDTLKFTRFFEYLFLFFFIKIFLLSVYICLKICYDNMMNNVIWELYPPKGFSHYVTAKKHSAFS